jgi:flagellar L-ring protein precursor FlgH
MLKQLSLVCVVSFGLAGCMTTQHEVLKHSPDFAPVYPVAKVNVVQTTGSIFNAQSGTGFFGSGGSRFKVGDVITVLLNESAQANRTQNTTTSREANNDALPAGFNTKIGNISPFGDGIDLNTATIDSTGSGTAGQQASLTGEVAVTVIDVLANGNLVLRGEKQLALSEGTETIQVSGVIRPDDVSPNNTVQSRRLANAQIAYRGSGELQQASSAGWATRLLFNFWPF